MIWEQTGKHTMSSRVSLSYNLKALAGAGEESLKKRRASGGSSYDGATGRGGLRDGTFAQATTIVRCGGCLQATVKADRPVFAADRGGGAKHKGGGTAVSWSSQMKRNGIFCFLWSQSLPFIYPEIKRRSKPLPLRSLFLGHGTNEPL